MKRWKHDSAGVAETVRCATWTTTDTRVCKMYADLTPRDGFGGTGWTYRHGNLQVTGLLDTKHHEPDVQKLSGGQEVGSSNLPSPTPLIREFPRRSE